jgi:hypothetical protein
MTREMTALELLWCVVFWLLVIWWLVARYRRGKWTRVPIGWLLLRAGMERLRFVFAWFLFLARERQRAHASQRIREFIAMADRCRPRPKGIEDDVTLLGRGR